MGHDRRDVASIDQLVTADAEWKILGAYDLLHPLSNSLDMEELFEHYKPLFISFLVTNSPEYYLIRPFIAFQWHLGTPILGGQFHLLFSK